ncbi:hypothetical protein GCM10007937_12610 [Mesorhizobium albiziae]|nr:hypothetical protein GCM10007937_12610 [Mesorhizobium albiziae]
MDRRNQDQKTENKSQHAQSEAALVGSFGPVSVSLHEDSPVAWYDTRDCRKPTRSRLLANEAFHALV